jgi:hypothetical protein
LQKTAPIWARNGDKGAAGESRDEGWLAHDANVPPDAL